MILQICKKLRFPEESLPVLEHAYRTILADAQTAQALDRARDSMMTPDCKEFLKIMSQIAEQTGVHPYTADMVLLLCCVEPLRKVYEKKGISEKVFWDTMEDLRYKLCECKTMYNVWGTPVAWWQKVFFVAKCFKLGRLQFETSSYSSDIPYKGMEKGKAVISLHIPRDGPLDASLVMDSLKQGYDFFKDRFADGVVPFTVFTWLIYPPYMDSVFPKNGNVQKFAALFHILSQEVDDSYENFPGVFGCPFQGADFDTLPQKTSLQRNLLAYLRQGKPMGRARGIFFYGENGIVDESLPL